MRSGARRLDYAESDVALLRRVAWRHAGAIGGAHFTPIVNTPEVAILGLGRGAMKPVARDEKVVIRMMTPLGLSYDHRAIDGGEAARFIVDLVAALQDFKEAAVKI